MQVSVEQAKKSLGQFLSSIDRHADFAPGRLEELLGEPTADSSPNAGPLWTFRSPFGTFWVAQRTAEVLLYAAPESDSAGAPSVTAEAAQAASLRFIHSVYHHFDERTFALVDQQETEDAFRFDYEEAARPPETSIFPNFISVSVTRDRGSVSRYACSNLPFRRMTPPRISESEARDIIQTLIASSNGRIERLRLVEEPLDNASRSVTVWSASVVLQAGVFQTAERIAINADTGERINLP